MKFADFIVFDAVNASLQSDRKDAVIRELAESLAAAGAIKRDDLEAILKSIMKREELGSTGIGRGIAVPHTKHGSVPKLVGAMGVSHEGIDFNSLDGEKVHLFFLLVSPLDRPSDHLRALENVTRQLRNDDFCRFLKQAQTPAEIKTLLDEADHRAG